MSYVELHCHSNYSFQEGASSIDEMVSRAVELGYPALALTDHDNLCGTMEFAQVARSLDIQPISGAEVTTEAGGHLTFLASDRIRQPVPACHLLLYGRRTSRPQTQ